MLDKTPVNAPAIAVLPLLLIWMAVLLPVYHPNMGGGGLALPQNILAWSVMALTTLIVTFTVCLGRTRLSLTPRHACCCSASPCWRCRCCIPAPSGAKMPCGAAPVC